MLAYFQQHFDYLHAFNLRLIRLIEENDFDNLAIHKTISILLNEQHIASCNILSKPIESDVDDVHAIQFWMQLENDNHQNWTHLFLQFEVLNVSKDTLYPSLFLAIGKNYESIGVLKYLLKKEGVNLEDSYLFPVD